MSLPSFETTTFSSKKEAVSFVLDKVVADKKPHKVIRSCQERYTVGCREEDCLFRISVRKRTDGLFHIASFHEHTCTKLFPTVKTNWVRTKAKEMISNQRITGPNGLQNMIRVDYGVNIKKGTSQRAILKAGASLSREDEGFESWQVSSTPPWRLTETQPGTLSQKTETSGGDFV